MDLGLSGRAALVTGASKGLGRAIALALAGEGMDVAIVARNRDGLEAVKREIEGKGRRALAHVADLKEPAAATAAVEAAVKAFGKLDLLVNNAGATKGGDFLNLTDADWTDSFGLKFFTYVRMSRVAWPHLKAARGGIVNIAGVAGRTGASDFVAVGAVNAALALVTKALADRGVADGVRVNAINPGVTVTNLHRRGGMSEENYAAFLTRAKETHPLGRPGQAHEMAAMILFLASEKAAFITGETIAIDGGRHLTCAR